MAPVGPRKRAERHAADHAVRAGDVGGGEAPNAIRPREGPNNRYLSRLLYLGAMAHSEYPS
mgnify:CR=1 FL=1